MKNDNAQNFDQGEYKDFKMEGDKLAISTKGLTVLDKVSIA
jgi:hypothetical protein